MTPAPHSCPVSGGAHHFRPDDNGVPICSCNEIELTLDERLFLVEFEAEPPVDDVRSLYEHVRALLARYAERKSAGSDDTL